jgi:hypothetical protein
MTSMVRANQRRPSCPNKRLTAVVEANNLMACLGFFLRANRFDAELPSRG